VRSISPRLHCGRCGHPSCRSFAVALGKGSAWKTVHFWARSDYAPNWRNCGNWYGRTLLTLSPAWLEARPAMCCSALPGNRVAGGHLPFRSRRPGASRRTDHLPTFGLPDRAFRNVLDVNHSILTIHLTGPLNRLGENDYHPLELGICQIAAFEGVVLNDRILEVGRPEIHTSSLHDAEGAFRCGGPIRGRSSRSGYRPEVWYEHKEH